MRTALLRVVVAVVSICMVLTTASRVTTWTSEEGLWIAAVRVAPDKPRPWINLGRQLTLRGEDGLAAAAFARAASLAAADDRSGEEHRRDRFVAELNLAVLHARHGELPAAIALAAHILAREPDAPFARALYETWLNERDASYY